MKRKDESMHLRGNGGGGFEMFEKIQGRRLEERGLVVLLWAGKDLEKS